MCACALKSFLVSGKTDSKETCLENKLLYYIHTLYVYAAIIVIYNTLVFWNQRRVHN